MQFFLILQIKREIVSCGAIAKTKELAKKYRQQALNALAHFADSDARKALENVIKILTR